MIRELLTSAEMRALEAAAIAAGRMTGADLMDRAGSGVVAAIAAHWPDAAAGRVVVLCGPGNNGGDGLVIARLLSAAGYAVEVFLLGALPHLPADASANAELWRASGQRFGDLVSPAATSAIDGADLVIDAIFGIGLTRPLPADLADLLAALARARRTGTRVVAVDLPSGLCADSGRPLGPAVTADLTVTFHSPKPGHYLAEGPARCGALRVVDLGLTGRPGTLTLADLGTDETRILAKSPDLHKYGHGHLFVLSGHVGEGGAARLAARAALRVGAGLVTLGVPPAAEAENAAQLNSIMLTRIFSAETLEKRLADSRINALCVGPGLVPGTPEGELMRICLESRRPMVIDAGGIALLAVFDELAELAHDGCVLTPHDGEFARLFPHLGERLSAPPISGPAFSRADAARAASAQSGCVILLKGPDTVIAGPDGRCSIHSAAYGREAGWLATAGAGDVLAGLIAGLMARGLAPFDAARTGAWLHVEAARAFGPGLIAEDLPETLPQVFRALGL